MSFTSQMWPRASALTWRRSASWPPPASMSTWPRHCRAVYRIDSRVPIDTPVTASWTPSASSPSEKQRPRKKQNRGGRTNLTWRPWRGEQRDRSAGEAAALAMELDGRGHEKKTRPRRRRDAGLARERGDEVSSTAREVQRRRCAAEYARGKMRVRTGKMPTC